MRVVIRTRSAKKLPTSSADERHAGGVAAGRGDEHHEDDDQHLGEIAQAALAGIVLQVGIGHEADDGVEGQRRLHISNAVGVEQRNTLNPQDQVADGHHDGVGPHQGQSILFPVHSLVGINTADFVDYAVDPVKHRVTERVFPCGDMIHIPPNRNDNDQKDDNCQRQLKHTIFLLCLLTSLKPLGVYQRIDQVTAQQYHDNAE